MSTALLHFALGTLALLPEGRPSLPEGIVNLGLDYLDPRFAQPADFPEADAPPEAAVVAPAPAPGIPVPTHAHKAVIPPAKLPSAGETTRYRVAYGMLGELGEIKISFSFPTDKIHAVGSGAGSLFGLGRIEKRLEAELLPGVGSSRRWVASRIQSGKTIVDTVEQTTPGQIAVLRRRSDRPEEGHRFTRESPVLDPLAFLWRLRSRPPERRETFEILDGRALWKIAVDPTRVRSDGPKRTVLVISGHAEPIFWDGQPDSDRTARRFTLYLEGDAQHTPLRLVMPLAVGEVRVDLTAVVHPAGRATVQTAGKPAVQSATSPDQALPPGTSPPGTVLPGTMSPGTMSPGTVLPGTVLIGRTALVKPGRR